MKRFILSLLIPMVMAVSAGAMSYEEARQRAWFLTDKMAYELNLTPEQYDRAYQVNLDYLMSLRSPSDYSSGRYWKFRDADLRCILFDWQYSLYASLDYFFRPIRWVRSAWYFPIFDRYRRGYYYFERPKVYVSYHGGSWHKRGHNARSPYWGMTFRPGGGMRDHFHNKGPKPSHRPDYNRPGHGNVRPPHSNGNRPPSHNNRPDHNKGHRPGNNTRPGNSGRPSENKRPSRTPGNSRPSRGSFGSSHNEKKTKGNAAQDRSNRSGRQFGR